MDLRPQTFAHTQRYPGVPAGRIILFMGAPGCGKGTQSSMLAERTGIDAISTGDILRQTAAESTPQGLRLREIMASGALVDDATVCDAVISRIRTMERGSGSLILDGFPRTVGQAKKLDRVLEALGIDRPLVLHLDVPKEILVQRLSMRRQCATCARIYSITPNSLVRCESDGGPLVERPDDNEQVVLKRLAAYEAETLPVLEYYRRRGGQRYRRIDGCLTPAEIANDVRDIVLFAGTPVAA
ncbi:MAG TPA: nucleoside monophosphate kinase [Bryobacteraceae bacterium]|nr:nucleoside monophosphate kinase [Bryobacteraceae bacterium]